MFVTSCSVIYCIYIRTYKMPVRYILLSEWVRLSIFSQLSIIQHVGLCVFSLSISFVMIGRIYILCLIIIIKSEVWTIIHCLRLDHETMVCAVCLSIFYGQLRCYHVHQNSYTCIYINYIFEINIFMDDINLQIIYYLRFVRNEALKWTVLWT